MGKAKTKLTQEIVDMFWLFANMQRLRMAELISRDAWSTPELVEEIGVNPGTIHTGITYLRAFGLIKEGRDEERRVRFSLDKERLVATIYEFAEAMNLDLSKPPAKKKIKKTKSYQRIAR